MAVATLSFAQSLRVIGQDLEGLEAHAFELAKLNDEYIVALDHGGVRGEARNRTILKRIGRKIHGIDDAQTSNRLRFTQAGLFWTDSQRRLQRGAASGVPDAGKLSLALRVLGNFLDERGAVDFAISWSADSKRVSYDGKVESFTTDNLYDLGVRMYLRRSSRGSAR
jgi:hypothetical protein